MTTCPLCNSTGKVDAPVKGVTSYAQRITCPQCEGSGSIQEVEPQATPKADGADSGTESLGAPEL